MRSPRHRPKESDTGCRGVLPSRRDSSTSAHWSLWYCLEKKQRERREIYSLQALGRRLRSRIIELFLMFYGDRYSLNSTCPRNPTTLRRNAAVQRYEPAVSSVGCRILWGCLQPSHTPSARHLANDSSLPSKLVFSMLAIKLSEIIAAVRTLKGILPQPSLVFERSFTRVISVPNTE